MVKIGEEILSFVNRFGLAMPRLLTPRSFDWVDSEEDTEAKLRILVNTGLLGSFPLIPGYHDSEHYYYLTRSGCEAIAEQFVTLPRENLDLKAAGTRAACYAIATFCAVSDLERIKMTTKEFREDPSQLWYTGQPNRDYCWETTAEIPQAQRPKVANRKLVAFRIDRGNKGGWQRELEYAERFMNQRRDLKHRASAEFAPYVERWRELYDDGQFWTYVLTPHESKAERFNRQIGILMCEEQRLIPIRAFHVPGFFEILHPRPKRGRRSGEGRK